MSTPTTTRPDSALAEDGRCGGARPGSQHALALIQESRRWANHARASSQLPTIAIHRKSLDALALTLRVFGPTLLVPSKLKGTSAFQGAIELLCRAEPGFGEPLQLTAVSGALKVSAKGMLIGYVQRKHEPWLRPLVPFGARLRLLQVTGTTPDKTYGVNVAFSGLGEAITRYQAAQER